MKGIQLNSTIKTILKLIMWLFFSLILATISTLIFGNTYGAFFGLAIVIGVMVYAVSSVKKSAKSALESSTKETEKKTSLMVYFFVFLVIVVMIAFIQNMYYGFVALFLAALVGGIVYTTKHPESIKYIAAAKNGFEGRSFDDTRTNVQCINCGHQVYGMWAHNNPCVKVGKKCIDPLKIRS